MNPIPDNLSQVRRRIKTACIEHQRDHRSINLIAVSKTKSVADVASVFEAGQLHFGENYLQEAALKVAALPAAHWHFIGAIQSNKTRVIAEKFSYVHGVSNFKIAKRLNDHRPASLEPLGIFFQVNIDDEATKSGASAELLYDLVKACSNLPQLSLMGLMAIPRPSLDFQEQRAGFRKLALLRQSISNQLDLTGFTELSMGMSNDLEAAIAEGATWVRIGTAIFGARAPKIT
ncbi:MAG: YggS family pyridoxal phosphate-dependent enzyme [Gammaproteobacteria bacterium]|jgi:PLP dependent protein|nr:YggS family pyridoxal phosphate-dependent enzyme [Gammaproteobacteria bacterium]MBT5204252.1 YggS family pyridoxal phosphate-dependent enzyme [Gammaproteobacteria bacterium]MBT5602535.1 YggS family pyridoxal phosphate-dependent enzyme [Gammaproteobacteria bacterium]